MGRARDPGDGESRPTDPAVQEKGGEARQAAVRDLIWYRRLDGATSSHGVERARINSIELSV
ncbi:hypothetical protein [Streptomyces atratus]|uniref:hypothetical protein n=1 Tax=Streptomyces atratus TaxID=1893 RepID=UPI00116143AD|nr:hypothetical protein [Streptomyces atratus]